MAASHPHRLAAIGIPICRPPFRWPRPARLAALRRVAMARGYAALVVYGDREHAANIHWLTGFDPRFEEAVLVVTPTMRC